MRRSSLSMLVVALVSVAITAACSKAPQPASSEVLPAPPNPVQADPPLGPPAAIADSFPDCTWAETRGAGVSLWAFDCPTSRIIADDKLPGLVQVYEGDSAPQPSILIQLFEIAEGAPIDSITPAVRDASPAPGIALCTLQPSETMAGWHELRPTGALKDSYGKFIAGVADEPSMPCGALGPSEGGGRYFKLLNGLTTKVALVHMPSDIPGFDIDTLTAAK